MDRQTSPYDIFPRYALNYKGVQYKTEWVELTQVTSVRQKLNCPPVRFHGDGSPFYTLPVIQDPSTDKVIGDTFDIAVYLDKICPDGPPLFPPSSIGLHKAFNAQVDAIFSQFAGLCANNMPFNPETAEQSKSEFLRRAGMTGRWEEILVLGEKRVKMVAEFKDKLGELAKFYLSDGPFLEGQTLTYADIIVGGWLQFLKATIEEWEDLLTWHDRRWRKIHEALAKYAEVK
jgi:glutathione S-transferase